MIAASLWLMTDRSLPPDRIILEGMQFYGFHGANPEERALGQSYVVDLAVELDLKKAGASDTLEDTVSYPQLYRAVQNVVEGESKNLLEATAEAIANRVLAEFPVKAVKVLLKKPRPPIRGSVIDNAAVEIYRVQEDKG
jgi:dihydroneopterin aldolase